METHSPLIFAQRLFSHLSEQWEEVAGEFSPGPAEGQGCGPGTITPALSPLSNRQETSVHPPQTRGGRERYRGVTPSSLSQVSSRQGMHRPLVTPTFVSFQHCTLACLTEDDWKWPVRTLGNTAPHLREQPLVSTTITSHIASISVWCLGPSTWFPLLRFCTKIWCLTTKTHVSTSLILIFPLHPRKVRLATPYRVHSRCLIFLFMQTGAYSGISGSVPGLF